jgi:diadenosine tetraphosphate (Ap4A) HIT family hydrolase
MSSIAVGYCRFCVIISREPERVVAKAEHVVSIEGDYPAVPGHVLVMPRRHASRVEDLSEAEYSGLWSMARSEMVRLGECDGFTVGINDGMAAGQTVGHVHLHVVPRYDGDVKDPRGGILRGCPDESRYLSR